MRVLLDDSLCQMEVDNVGQAIAAAAVLAEERGRMIVEVMVDGEHWTEVQLNESATHSRTAHEIRLTSADPDDLVCAAFRDASRALTDANTMQQKAAELLQAGEIAQAMEPLQDAISIWLSVQQALLMGLELTSLEIEGASSEPEFPLPTDSDSPSPFFKAMIDELNGRLRQMHDALAAQDTVALADTLLYELPAVVTRWQDLLDDLQEQIQSRSKEG